MLTFNPNSVLLYLQVRSCPLAGSSPDQVSHRFLMYSNVTTANPIFSGAQVVFNSLLQPLVGRYFNGGSTSANLRAQADAATKEQ